MTSITTTDEPRAKQIASAQREERVGPEQARREELLKRPNWKTKKETTNGERSKSVTRDGRAVN